MSEPLWFMMATVTPRDRDRLRALALRLALDEGGWGDDAVELAADLLALGEEGPATVELACLSRGVTTAVAAPLLRQMLREHGVEMPAEVLNDRQRIDYLVRAFAWGVAPIELLATQIYCLVPDWEEQTAFEREVVLALDKWESAADVKRRQVIVDDLRQRIATYIDGNSGSRPSPC